METSYSGKVWERTKRMVLSCREEGLWCWLVEGDQRKLGSFKARTSFMVGNGRRTKFWHDDWCGDAPFKDSFPSFFSFAPNKEVWMVNAWEVVSQVS